jgi:hypothetical protein
MDALDCSLSLTTIARADLMTDMPRLRQGMVGAQFWSVYVTCGEEAYNGSRAVQATMEQIDVVYRLIEVPIHYGALLNNTTPFLFSC